MGLRCGHKFCRPCALGAAGFGGVFGSFANVVTYVPARTPCPQCRQRNVFHSAVVLREVGALIKERYPEEWEERRAEDKRRGRVAVEERISLRDSISFYDLLT